MKREKTIKAFSILRVVIALAMVTLLFTTSYAAEKPIKLRVAGIHPIDAILSAEVTLFFNKRVEELTKGMVTFEYYPFESLVKGPDLLSATSSGVIDIENMVYAAGKVPSFMVMQIPYSYKDDEIVKASLAMHRLATDPKGLIYKQFTAVGVRPLFAFGTTNYQLHTVNKQIKTLDDFRGVKVRTAGSVLPNTIKNLGGVPVSMTIGDAYSAMEKGVVDGIMLGIGCVPDFPIHPLVHHTNISFDTGCYPTVWAINPRTFDSLSPEHKKIFTQVAEETSINVSTKYLSRVKRLIKEWRASSNHTVDDLSPENLAKARKLVSGVPRSWAEEMEAKGLQGKQLLESWRTVLKAQGVTPSW
jgi:TRAP-type C4-dicarboxylate transport system substrate-binding protein